MRKKVPARFRKKNRQARINELQAELEWLLHNPDADSSPFHVKEEQLAQLAALKRKLDLNMGERFLMFILIYRANAYTGACFPGLDDIGRLMGSYRSEVLSIRERCRQKGILSWQGSKGKRTYYQFHLRYPLSVDDAGGPASDAPPVGRGLTGIKGSQAKPQRQSLPKKRTRRRRGFAPSRAR